MLKLLRIIGMEVSQIGILGFVLSHLQSYDDNNFHP